MTFSIAGSIAGVCPKRKPYLANIYLFKVNKRNTRKKCEICSELTKVKCEICFIVNFEHISDVSLVFLLLNLNKQMLVGYFGWTSVFGGIN